MKRDIYNEDILKTIIRVHGKEKAELYCSMRVTEYELLSANSSFCSPRDVGELLYEMKFWKDQRNKLRDKISQSPEIDY